MKKNISVWRVMLGMGMMTLITFACMANGGRDAKNDKELNKVVRQWSKEGWKLHGSSLSLRSALQLHYERLSSNPDLTERVGTATNCTSVTVCRLAALNSACMEYAMSVAGEAKGLFEQFLFVNESTGEEYDKFKTSFAGKMELSIRGQLQESFALIKKENGKNQYMIFYLLDRKEAERCYLKALEDAIGEAGVETEAGIRLMKSMEKIFKGK